MTVTVSSSLAPSIVTANVVNAITLASVPANGTILLGILDRSDETTALSTIADTVNGAWTPNLVVGPVDFTNGTSRLWLAYFLNSAAGSPVITTTFDTAINSQVAACWISSDQGVMTFDVAATTSQHATSTDIDSNTLTAAGAGAIVGFLTTGNSQADPEPTADGAGESRVTSGAAGARAFLFFEAYASGGTKGIETTCDSTVAAFAVGAFLEPATSNVNLLVGKFGALLKGKLA